MVCYYFLVPGHKGLNYFIIINLVLQFSTSCSACMIWSWNENRFPENWLKSIDVIFSTGYSDQQGSKNTPWIFPAYVNNGTDRLNGVQPQINICHLVLRENVKLILQIFMIDLKFKSISLKTCQMRMYCQWHYILVNCLNIKF